MNIEIQRKNQLDFGDRALYYWVRLFSSDLNPCDDYSDLFPTIALCLVDFILFPKRTEYSTEIVRSRFGSEVP